MKVGLSKKEKFMQEKGKLPQDKTPCKKLQTFLKELHEFGYVIESIEDNNYILKHGNTRMVIEYKEDEPLYQIFQRLHLNHRVMIEADRLVKEKLK